MKNKNRPSTAVKKMTADERLAFIRSTAETRPRTRSQFTSHLPGWLTCNSPSNRHASTRAADYLPLVLNSGHAKGCLHTLQLDKLIRVLALGGELLP
ncbi:MAG: hypothetical protein WA173_03270 [Pseudomonas sp.]|uniref:hypothetical protein n=1 Tax=Pseudomonas sp. TaxID=306 RepID=UPI003BB502BD